MGDPPTRKATGADSPALDVTLPADSTSDRESRGHGPKMGRYVLGETLGSGGMGVVYRARDPDLDRELAIKLVLPAIAGRRAHERLLSEARAMAKLRHPNVVPVFDVGITQQGVYVVMPLVPGGTLHDWLAAEPRPWRDVVARFVAAGRGLAAGHAVGIVHRDFKPRNILIDEHGTVLVADFGLANLPPAPSSGGGDPVVTSVVGTPAYMAPEQAAGAAVDARADQYSFCISFWEGLHGKRPSHDQSSTRVPSDDASSRDAADDAADNDVVVPPVPPRSHDHEPPPTWLQLAIARGFSADPARRWPSMNALLDDIEARLRERRRISRGTLFWVAAGVVSVGAAAATALLVRGDDERAHDRSAPTTKTIVDDSSTPTLSAPRQVTTTGGCVYAPAFVNDDTIAFDVDLPTGEVDMHTLQLSTKSLRRITDAATWEWRAGRGATANELLYLVTDLEKPELSHIAARDLASGAERRIATGPIGAVTASGDSYYYIGNYGHELRRQRANIDERVMEIDQLDQAQSLATSPDGRQLALTGLVGGANFGVCMVDVESRTLSCPQTVEPAPGARVDYGPRGDLYIAGLDGVHVRDRIGVDREIVPNVRAFGGVAVAPSGKALVYTACTAYGAVREVGVEPARYLSEEDRLTDPIAGPDGAVAWMRGRREIFARRADGTVRNLLGPGHRGDVFRSPAFDASGRRIAFTRKGASHGIWVVEVDASMPEQQITYDETDDFPLFLSDGSIVFTRKVGEQPFVFRVVPGHEPSQAFDRPRQTDEVDRKTGRVLLRSNDQMFLYWWDPETGRETPGPAPRAPGTQNTYGVSISPDGNWFLYQSGSLGHELWRTPTATWKPELVFTAPSSSTMEYASITDDGHPLIVEKVWHGELFAVDVTRGSL